RLADVRSIDDHVGPRPRIRADFRFRRLDPQRRDLAGDHIDRSAVAELQTLVDELYVVVSDGQHRFWRLTRSDDVLVLEDLDLERRGHGNPTRRGGGSPGQ